MHCSMNTNYFRIKIFFLAENVKKLLRNIRGIEEMDRKKLSTLIYVHHMFTFLTAKHT